MCGICGIIYNDKNKSVDKATLSLMNNKLNHRGPDEEGYFIKGNVGLGMRRLSIIDIKGGHQPIFNEDKTISVICNGQIYNYLELREDLEKQGHRFLTHCDTEVIVHLYEDLKEEFVHKLRGMFAIAIYDLSKEKLILVRDRLGIKPLYYSFQEGNFLFASELKAILQYPGLKTSLSLAALSDYLTYLYIPAPETIFSAIYKLLPANMLVYNEGKILIKKYWELNYQKDNEHDEECYVQSFKELLKESVKMHLMSEVPLGAFLSGGMDSSSIVAMMSEVANEPVKTFSVGFDVPGFNELGFAKSVAEKFNTDHHEIILNPDIVTALPKIVRQFDEPFADSSAIPTYLISEFAKRYVTVCLAGDGGDELFAGYGWTRRQKFIEDYHQLPSGLRDGLKNILLGNDYALDSRDSFLAKVKRFMYDADMPLAQSFMRRKTCFSEEMKRRLFREDTYEQIAGYKSISKILPFFHQGGIDNSIERLLFLDTKLYLPDDGLCKVDRMSMMNSLEVRVPFLDHKVVEFVASIPFKYKMRGSVSKYLLKKAMRDKLPASILRQRKLGFTLPLNSWFRGRLKNFAENILNADCNLKKLINLNYLNWMLSEHFAGKQAFGSQIYALIILELWLKENGKEVT